MCNYCGYGDEKARCNKKISAWITSGWQKALHAVCFAYSERVYLSVRRKVVFSRRYVEETFSRLHARSWKARVHNVPNSIDDKQVLSEMCVYMLGELGLLPPPNRIYLSWRKAPILGSLLNWWGIIPKGSKTKLLRTGVFVLGLKNVCNTNDAYIGSANKITSTMNVQRKK